MTSACCSSESRLGLSRREVVPGPRKRKKGGKEETGKGHASAKVRDVEGGGWAGPA